MTRDLKFLADCLGGRVSGVHIRAPGPGRAADDDSLVVVLSRDAPDGFVVYSLAEDDPIDCREHVLSRLRLVEAAPLSEPEPSTVADQEPGANVVNLAGWRQSKAAATQMGGGAAKPLGTEGGDLDPTLLDQLRFAADPAARLVAIVETECELFHARNGTPYAHVPLKGRREALPISSKPFKVWLARRYWEETKSAAKADAINTALGILQAKALFDGAEQPVFIRVASLDGRLFLDLCNDAGQVVEIDATGWRVIKDPQVRFRRAAGMQPLPVPVAGGSIETLRAFLNVRSDEDFVLAVGWLLAALRDRGPYPVLVLSGEQGSAKSTFSEMLRALVDPNTAPLRALPHKDRDLFIAVNNAHVLAFDNLSGLPHETSDTLCSLATGGGFATRQLFTDLDETLIDAARPVILNGIEDIVTRPDLADRALFLTLAPIPDERRRPKQELWQAFEAARPGILGTLLDAVVEGLRRLPETRLERLPRMADFALWATACEMAFWPASTLVAAYHANIATAAKTVVEGDLVADTIQRFMEMRTSWRGTASDLLAELNRVVPDDTRRMRGASGWPPIPNQLSRRLRRAAPTLRRIGIGVAFSEEGRRNTRYITLTRYPDQGADGSLALLAREGDPKDGNRSKDLPASNEASGDCDVGGTSLASAGPSADDADDVPDRASDSTAREKAEGVQALGLSADDASDDPTPT